MPKKMYCWRCQMDVPMLTDDEWELVAPHLKNVSEEIRTYRAKTGQSLADAKKFGYGDRALEIYEKITGVKETNPNVLWHHRVSAFGPPCQACGKPLRTPRAKFCAACGAER